jgi:hypothetical protein
MDFFKIGSECWKIIATTCLRKGFLFLQGNNKRNANRESTRDKGFHARRNAEEADNGKENARYSG